MKCVIIVLLAFLQMSNIQAFNNIYSKVNVHSLEKSKLIQNSCCEASYFNKTNIVISNHYTTDKNGVPTVEWSLYNDTGEKMIITPKVELITNDHVHYNLRSFEELELIPGIMSTIAVTLSSKNEEIVDVVFMGLNKGKDVMFSNLVQDIFLGKISTDDNAKNMGDIASLYSSTLYTTDNDGDGRMSVLKFITDSDANIGGSVTIDYKGGVYGLGSCADYSKYSTTWTITGGAVDSHEFIVSTNSSNISLCSGSQDYVPFIKLYAYDSGIPVYQGSLDWSDNLIGFERTSQDTTGGSGGGSGGGSNDDSGGGGSTDFSIIALMLLLVGGLSRKYLT